MIYLHEIDELFPLYSKNQIINNRYVQFQKTFIRNKIMNSPKKYENDPLRIVFQYMSIDLLKQCLIDYLLQFNFPYVKYFGYPGELFMETYCWAVPFYKYSKPYVIKDFANKVIIINSRYSKERLAIWNNVMTKTKIITILKILRFPNDDVKLRSKEELIQANIHLIHALQDYKNKQDLFEQMLFQEYYAPPNAGYLQTKNKYNKRLFGI